MNIVGSRAVFLDRDGVINDMVYNAEFGLVDSPANPDQLNLLPGVGDSIAALNEMGFKVFIVSNQPGIAKGKFNSDLLRSMTEKMLKGVAKCGGKIDKVYYCLHLPKARVESYRISCDCRKPRPGLLTRAAEEWNIQLEHSYMVGDGITDIEAGQAVGATTIFVNDLKCYICKEMRKKQVRPDFIVTNLLQAVRVIRRSECGDKIGLSSYRFDCEI